MPDDRRARGARRDAAARCRRRCRARPARRARAGPRRPSSSVSTDAPPSGPSQLARGIGDARSAASDLRRAGREQDAAPRRAAGQCARPARRTPPAGQRRNGLPALTWMTIELRIRGHAGGGQHRSTRRRALGRLRHLGRVVGGVERRDAERREQIRLVRDRVPRPQLARAIHAVGVHPAAAGNRVADRAAARR